MQKRRKSPKQDRHVEQIPEPEEPKQSQQRGPVHLQQLAGRSLHIACETEKHPPAAEEGQEFLKVVEDEASGVLPAPSRGISP